MSIYPYVIHAQEEKEKVIKFIPEIKIPGFEETEIGEKTLGKYIASFYKWAVTTLAILAVVIIMISGLQWIMAAGNPPAIQKAKAQMTSAIIGLVLVLLCIPILKMINPALVRLSTFKIPGIKRIEVIPPADFFNDILPPIDWYRPAGLEYGGEPEPKSRSCGKETIISIGEKKRKIFGIECNKPEEVCVLKLELEIDSNTAEKMNKGEIKLSDLSTQIKKKAGACVSNLPSVTLASKDHKKTVVYSIASADLCGKVVQPPPAAKEKEMIGSVCLRENEGTPQFKFSRKFCTFILFTLNTSGENLYYSYIDSSSQSSCFLGAQLRSCPEGYMRRICSLCPTGGMQGECTGGQSSTECSDEVFFTDATKRYNCCAKKEGGKEYCQLFEDPHFTLISL